MKIINALSLLLPILMFSPTSMACDDKACEVAYLSSTTQYVDNYYRRANTERTERWAYAKNRERRDYAVVNHLQRMRFNSALGNK